MVKLYFTDGIQKRVEEEDRKSQYGEDVPLYLLYSPHSIYLIQF